MKTNDYDIKIELVGGIPVVASCMKKMKFAETIDELLGEIRSNGNRFSHGKTCFVFLLYLLCRGDVISKVSEWVSQTAYLRVLFPDIKNEYFNEDRLEDTLDAIHKSGIQNLFASQVIKIIEAFKLEVNQVHLDLTAFSVYGDHYDENGYVIINYGHSKDGRDDLKQFCQEAGVSNDGGVPVTQTTLSGNTNDSTRYVPMWWSLKNILQKNDFLIVGDCKLTSQENMLTICRNRGYYLGPLTSYSSVNENLDILLDDEPELMLLHEVKKAKGKVVVYSGVERTNWLADPETNQPYLQRWIYIHSTELEHTALASFDARLEELQKRLTAINEKVNTKWYGTSEKIEEAVISALSHQKFPADILTFNINESLYRIPVKKKGRPSSNNQPDEYIEKKLLKLEYTLNEEKILKLKRRCGYFVLVTNKEYDKLSMKEALLAYKEEWKVEGVFSRLKGTLQVIPMRLKLTNRIESMMYLQMTCVQIYALIDREAKNRLASGGEKLVGLFPKKRAVASPKTEFMLEALDHFGLAFTRDEDEFSVRVSGVSPFVKKLFILMNVIPAYYDNKFVSSQLSIAETLDSEELYQAMRFIEDYTGIS